MATHSIVLAWRIPWAEEPGGLQSMEAAKSKTLRSDYHTLGGPVSNSPAVTRGLCRRCVMVKLHREKGRF